ncbi:Uncharacterised protein [uncultured archaeon]|nr:Uncharacterised protein [uncultured archaeon]
MEMNCVGLYQARNAWRPAGRAGAFGFCGLGRRGQAAVTDAIYFLIVVSFLSIFLFSFANSYGNNVRDRISNEYSTTFATNALKTILYSSTPRDPSKGIYGPSQADEIDYLLALVKEDYADNADISPSTRVVLGKTVSAVMRPVADSKDYLFYITIPTSNGANQEGKFVYIFAHSTNFETSAFSSSMPDYIVSMKTGNPSHRDYFCGVATGPNAPDYGTLLALLSRLFANVGPVSQASAQIKLVEEISQGSADRRNFRAQADLAVWDATWLGTTSDRAIELFDPGAWGCEEVNWQ